MNEKIILGIDEVGRGPWAGPLVIGAVILENTTPSSPKNSNPTQAQSKNSKPSSSTLNPSSNHPSTNITPDSENPWQNLTDSKKLTEKKREELNKVVLEHAAACATGWVSVAELDKIGLSSALKLATRRAVKQILAKKIYFDEIVIDGTINFLAGTPLEDRVTTLPKADFLIPAVSAASIIAKVARDHYMQDLSEKYPEYSFEKHVGYGTAAHKSALENFGPCPEHRRSFRPVKEIAERWQPKSADKSPQNLPEPSAAPSLNTTTIGTHAESLVAAHLESMNHEILARNYKTREYEIDIISKLDNKIYFTEVKYRKNQSHGASLAQITPKKRKQILFAAEKFLSENPQFANFDPLLAAAAVSGEPPKLNEWFSLSE